MMGSMWLGRGNDNMRERGLGLSVGDTLRT